MFWPLVGGVTTRPRSQTIPLFANPTIMLSTMMMLIMVLIVWLRAVNVAVSAG